MTAPFSRPGNLISIVTDGWSNIGNEHMSNFVLVSPNSPPALHKIVATDGTSQTESFSQIALVIKELGGPSRIASELYNDRINDVVRYLGS